MRHFHGSALRAPYTVISSLYVFCYYSYPSFNQTRYVLLPVFFLFFFFSSLSFEAQPGRLLSRAQPKDAIAERHDPPSADASYASVRRHATFVTISRPTRLSVAHAVAVTILSRCAMSRPRRHAAVIVIDAICVAFRDIMARPRYFSLFHDETRECNDIFAACCSKTSHAIVSTHAQKICHHHHGCARAILPACPKHFNPTDGA